MNITKDLMDEHQLILGYIRLLRGYVQQANHNAPGILLEKGPLFVEFIRKFADSFHHAKEEDILFKHMEAGGALTHCNPLPQMLYEHEEGRATVQAMLKALECGSEEMFSEAALIYAQLLEGHIYKEDNILYQMAEASLSDKQKSIVLDQYSVAEDACQSDVVWGKYSALYHELEAALDASKTTAVQIGVYR